jgi:hypothetical protein
MVSDPRTHNQIITSNNKKIQTVKLFYINIFDENDDRWRQRDYCLQIHLKTKLFYLRTVLAHLTQHQYGFIVQTENRQVSFHW